MQIIDIFFIWAMYIGLLYEIYILQKDIKKLRRELHDRDLTVFMR